MCLAVPVEVIAIDGQNADIKIDGIVKTVNVALIDQLSVGDYIVVHAGFAIQKWEQEAVDDYHRLMAEIRES